MEENKYQDVFGLGAAVGSVCLLLIVFIIAISCCEKWESFFALFK